MLPETLAPVDEILPSVTVTVELAVGSHVPLFVTMVTFQVPSYGDSARAGAVALPARMKATKIVAMAIEAHELNSLMGEDRYPTGGLFGPNVSKICRGAAISNNLGFTII
jgi:hypothetical protein